MTWAIESDKQGTTRTASSGFLSFFLQHTAPKRAKQQIKEQRKSNKKSQTAIWKGGMSSLNWYRYRALRQPGEVF